MLVSIPFQLWQLKNNIEPLDIHRALFEYYSEQKFVEVPPLSNISQIDKLDPEDTNGTNQLRIFVFSNKDNTQAVVCAQLDNLGKGASGQAVQNLNLMLGLEPTTGIL